MPDNLSQFLATNAHVTTGDLLEDARREAERSGKVIKISPRPGKIGVDAHRFDLGDGSYLWVAQHGHREVRIIVKHADMLLHAEFMDGALTLVYDAASLHAAVV